MLLQCILLNLNLYSLLTCFTPFYCSRKSGEESDGMSSLSRRELCETISNLKKKLSNAEKVGKNIAVIHDKISKW